MKTDATTPSGIPVLLSLLRRCADMGNNFSFDPSAPLCPRPLQPAAYPSSVEAACMQHIQNMGTTKFDPQSARHMAHLHKLWKAWHSLNDKGDRPTPSTPPPLQIPSKGWRRIGFQRENPVADIRGGGELSAANLAYFADTYPHTLMQIRRAKNRRYKEMKNEMPSYPIAAAGINITRLLTEIFNIIEPLSGTPKWFCQEQLPYYRFMAAEAVGNGNRSDGWSSDDGFNAINPTADYFKMGEKAFNELYCFVFQYLDHMWDQEEASYMDFNRILAQTKEDLVALLSSAPSHAGLWWLRMQTGLFINSDDFKPFGQPVLAAPRAQMRECNTETGTASAPKTSGATVVEDLIEFVGTIGLAGTTTKPHSCEKGGLVFASTTI